MLSEFTVNELISLIQNGTPVPGGGCVNALTGMLAASLVCMAANVTLAREKDSRAKDELRNIVEDMSALGVQFASLMDSDSVAHNLTQRAYEMKEDSADDRARKVEEIQLAHKNDVYVPIKVAKLACSLMRTLGENMHRFNSRAIVHAVMAAQLAKSTIACSRYAVLINLRAVKDHDFVVEFEALIDSLNDDSTSLLQAVSSYGESG